MKLKLKLFLLTLFTALVVCLQNREEKSQSDLALLNIEALADSEYAAYYCCGSGSMDCPNGVKVYMIKYTQFR